MPEALYERYKEALRRGHVARDKGQWAAALAAYAEAATIAPERALPHAAIGSVHLRLGQPEQALAAFAAALERAPDDADALEGMANALLALGRPKEAADTLDRLAAALSRGGRPVAALDAARRALELAESRARHQVLAELSAAVASSPLDEAARDALARAVGLLERSGVASEPAEKEAPPPPAGSPAGGPPGAPGGETGIPAGLPGAVGAGQGRDVGVEETGPAAELPIDGDPEALVEEAQEAAAAGRPDEAYRGFLAAAGAFWRGGRRTAALEACQLALALRPDDPAVHLRMAELYLDLGWEALAREKLDLLERFLQLDGRHHALAELRALRERLGAVGSPTP
jgi:tetratricopeptide (TPR) repeat protein